MLIKIIGTSHISQQSIDEIKAEVEKDRPDIIAVELDIRRAIALTSKQKSKISFRDIRVIGAKGFIFAKIGQIVQQKLGKMVGVEPGSEMKSALLLAKKEKIKVALIDQPIEITLRRFSQKLSWKEKFRFVGDIFRAIFFRKKQMELLGIEDEKEIFNLAKVPDSKLIDKLIGQLKVRYPNIYQVLVDDRNKFMVRALLNIQKKNPESKILVIVGAGHKKGMEELLAKKMLKLN